MKTLGLIVIVAALHCAVIGSVFFISGCGTTPKTETTPLMPVMPPPQAPKVQPAPAAPETKLPGAGGEYIVQAGDSLSVIARRCHVTKAELIAANKLTDPNKLKVGQKLILPAQCQIPPPAAPAKPAGKAKAKTESAKAVPAAETGVAAANEYVVKPGDNLSKIAAHCGVKVSALREANKLPSDKLKVGQKLLIPEAQASAPSESAAPAVGAEPPAPAGKGIETAPVAGGAATNAATASSSGIIHVVQPNEDLSSIAKLYAVTVDEIAELNQWSSSNRTVQAGQRLKIP